MLMNALISAEAVATFSPAVKTWTDTISAQNQTEKHGVPPPISNKLLHAVLFVYYTGFI